MNKNNIILSFLLATILCCIGFYSCSKHDVPPRILVFSKTTGYRHESIGEGHAALRKLCKENGYMIDSTEDASDFTEKNLKRYAAVVFLSTTGNLLEPAQKADFQRYIQAGGGFVGVHAATDTEYGWKWYGAMVGGYFQSHPAQQDADLHVKDHNHPATKHLPETWRRFDEWYNFKELNPKVNVLLTIDEKSYKGGENGDNHPMSWWHDYDGGRAFYTALGHTKESYVDPVFLQHLLGGLKYAIGSGKKLNYAACTTDRTPDVTRFVKTVYAADLTEPMEFDMLPDGKIILVERRGHIKLFDPKTGQINVAYKLPVNNTFEDGLMGLALDPNYAKNNWIYLYYSPVNESCNQLSRFIFRGDTLDRASEKIVLKVATQRDECCHTGGSITFDDKGILYLSTGDNTNPFDSDGFSPSDERAGRSAWDAQKSSANTMDLRGKILRILPKADGTYDTPKDNLFPDGKDGRPEIYVMGCRNPFRISVDSERNLLFWGEVGPDAGEPDSARGPAGHDEVNRARAAGFFGWPYFVGNNKPYREHDFSAKKSGPSHDPLHPVNNSPFNTGAKNLPPAQPAMIWYPYGNSPEFPMLGVGGRNAMAGPVYYCEKYPKETRFPDYYNGKLITYDWMRNWLMISTLDAQGNLLGLEPLADSIQLSRPMDMMIDKNGSVWVLEYGTQWFSSNTDARLSRIDYVRGNRAPIPSIAMDKIAGAAPCKTQISLKGTKDYDGDRLKYEIDFGDGSENQVINGIRPETAFAGFGMKNSSKKSPLDSITHIYTTPGTYKVTLKVTDEEGETAKIVQKVLVGNEPPSVVWDFNGKNKSFYNPGDVLNYKVKVEDLEDGSLDKGQIDATSIATTINYLETGFDITQIAQGHQTAKSQAEFSKGKALVDRSDCKTCHAIDHKINGPSYQLISEKYQKDDFAVRSLAAKIIKGGAGVWGETVMSAHPQISEEDAMEMVRWILTLGAPEKVVQAFPVEGSYTLALPAPVKVGKKVNPGTFLLQASYKDKGSKTQTALENADIIALRPAFMQAETADSMSRHITVYRPITNGDTAVLNDLKDKSFFLFKRVDLTGIRGVSVGVATDDKRHQFTGGRIELRLDGINGKLIGQVAVPAVKGNKMTVNELQIPIGSEMNDGKFHTLYFVVRNEVMASAKAMAVDWVRFNF
jgi:cytochrome c